MKTKSRAVRRNSCGYGLQDDVCVTGDVAVNDGCSPVPVSEDFGSGVSLSLQENSVSDEVVVLGRGFEHSVDMGVSLGCHPGPCDVVELPVRSRGGISINEPDSCRAFVAARSHRASGPVDYVGKGKRKADDISPPAYHGAAHVGTSVSASSLRAQPVDRLFSVPSGHSGAGTSRAPCIISQPNNVLPSTAPEFYSATPGVLPPVLPSAAPETYSATPQVFPPGTATYWPRQ